MSMTSNLARRLQTSLVILVAALGLASCARLPQAPLEPVQWQTHRAQVEALQHWTVQGKVGLRSPEHQGSARLRWQQTPESYQIRLSGPLGAGAVLLSGSDDHAQLEQAGEAPLYASSAEELLYQSTGWHLPLAPLSFWIRGLPARDLPVDQLHFNEHHLLAELHQGDWQLYYSHYGLQGEVFLPGRIVARHSQTQVTLVVHTWQLPHG